MPSCLPSRYTDIDICVDTYVYKKTKIDARNERAARKWEHFKPTTLGARRTTVELFGLWTVDCGRGTYTTSIAGPIPKLYCIFLYSACS